MRIVIDTNVLVSGIFFGGTPGRIIDGWLKGSADTIVTRNILREYDRVLARLGERYPQLCFPGLSDQIAHHGRLVEDISVDPAACEDPDDLKFLGAASKGNASWIISGDHHLLAIDGWNGIWI